jgi:hypothetical protein
VSRPRPPVLSAIGMVVAMILASAGMPWAAPGGYLTGHEAGHGRRHFANPDTASTRLQAAGYLHYPHLGF